MSKPKIVVYAVETGGMPKGPKYQNPQWFDAIHKDASKVIIVGDWPVVVAAYKDLGIPVEVVDRWPIVMPPEPQRAASITSIKSDASIPEGWESLPWAAPDVTQTMRFVAQQFTDAVVINRRHAAKIIREELARRG